MQALASLFACGQPGEPGFTPQAARCSASCKIPFRSIIKTRQISSGFYGGETGICSCLLQSNPCEIFLCFAKAFGQPLKTTHRVVFLTLSFKSLLLSIEKQNGQASLLVRFVWRSVINVNRIVYLFEILILPPAQILFSKRNFEILDTVICLSLCRDIVFREINDKIRLSSFPVIANITKSS